MRVFDLLQTRSEFGGVALTLIFPFFGLERVPLRSPATTALSPPPKFAFVSPPQFSLDGRCPTTKSGPFEVPRQPESQPRRILLPPFIPVFLLGALFLICNSSRYSSPPLENFLTPHSVPGNYGFFPPSLKVIHAGLFPVLPYGANFLTLWQPPPGGGLTPQAIHPSPPTSGGETPLSL